MTDLGAVSLTSTEATSTGVPAFKPKGGAERPDRHRALSVDLANWAVEIATTGDDPDRRRRSSRPGHDEPWHNS